MWNLLKTLSERDSARLRRLEATSNEHGDDIEQLLNLVPKINARLRQRARRESDAGADISMGDPDIVGGVPRQEFVGPLPTLSNTDHNGTHAPGVATFTKDELRARARAKGMMR